MWVELLDARDKGTDADIYGELRIDGKLAWEAPRSKKIYKVTGQTIDLLTDATFEYYYDKKNQWQVSCFLKDEDNVGDDDLGKFRFDLNPYALLPKGDSVTRTLTNQDDRDHNDGNSKLYVRITRIGLIDK